MALPHLLRGYEYEGEELLIQSERDLERFKERYGLSQIKKIY